MKEDGWRFKRSPSWLPTSCVRYRTCGGLGGIAVLIRNANDLFPISNILLSEYYWVGLDEVLVTLTIESPSFFRCPPVIYVADFS